MASGRACLNHQLVRSTRNGVVSRSTTKIKSSVHDHDAARTRYSVVLYGKVGGGVREERRSRRVLSVGEDGLE